MSNDFRAVSSRVGGFVALFYVEQSIQVWCWRYRLTAGGEWVSGESMDRSVELLNVVSCETLECRKLSDNHWSKVALQKYGEGTCRFQLEAKDDCNGPSGKVDLTAVVRGGVCIYQIEVAARQWLKGERFTYTGVLLGGGRYGPLFTEGEFFCENDRFIVTNVTPSEGSFIGTDSSETEAQDLSMQYMAFVNPSNQRG